MFNHTCDYTYQILSNIVDTEIQDILHVRICRICAVSEMQNLDTKEWISIDDALEEKKP